MTDQRINKLVEEFRNGDWRSVYNAAFPFLTVEDTRRIVAASFNARSVFALAAANILEKQAGESP